MQTTATDTADRASGEAPLPLLGIPGFAYEDLHDALRLADLTAAFDNELRALHVPKATFFTSGALTTCARQEGNSGALPATGCFLVPRFNPDT